MSATRDAAQRFPAGAVGLEPVDQTARNGARGSAKHALIGDVRGEGLMLGVELVSDRAIKTPASAEAARVFEAAKDAGVLLGRGGLGGNVFRIKPPLCFSRDDADFLLGVLDDALAAVW